MSKRNKNIRRMLFAYKVILNKNLVNEHILIKKITGLRESVFWRTIGKDYLVAE